jgi:MarR family transcriptional regulator, transcriptional regulator for hemolysin
MDLIDWAPIDDGGKQNVQQDVSTSQKQTSLSEDNNPVFQDIARFRAILFDALLKPRDMTMSQGWVLVHLVRENGLRQSDLADRLEVATVTTSKLIDRLEARGFVERRSDPEDRRSNRVYATAKAKSLVKVMTRTIFEVDEIANRGIDAAELETTLKVLRQMRTNLRTALNKK